jgi:hypothetical protein
LGTDPNVHDSMELDASGYTYLEVWANSLVPSTFATGASNKPRCSKRKRRSY